MVLPRFSKNLVIYSVDPFVLGLRRLCWVHLYRVRIGQFLLNSGRLLEVSLLGSFGRPDVSWKRKPCGFLWLAFSFWFGTRLGSVCWVLGSRVLLELELLASVTGSWLVLGSMGLEFGHPGGLFRLDGCCCIVDYHPLWAFHPPWSSLAFCSWCCASLSGDHLQFGLWSRCVSGVSLVLGWQMVNPFLDFRSLTMVQVFVFWDWVSPHVYFCC